MPLVVMVNFLVVWGWAWGTFFGEDEVVWQPVIPSKAVALKSSAVGFIIRSSFNLIESVVIDYLSYV